MVLPVPGKDAFEDQLHQYAECDLLAMEKRMRGRRRSETVVDGMSGGQPGRLETQPGQQRIRFHQALQGGRDHLHLHSPQRIRAIIQKSAIAQFRQRDRALGGRAAAHVAEA